VSEVATYAEYRAARVRCGYDAEAAMIESVWNGCDLASRQNMLGQLLRGAEEAEAAIQVWPSSAGCW